MSELSVIKDKIALFTNKYGMEFTIFENAVKSTANEDIEKWDDYIEWKVYEKKIQSLALKLSEIKDAVDFKIIKD